MQFQDEGYAKNCLTKKNLAVYQLGNQVLIDAYTRLEENMWSLRIELLTPAAVNFMSNSQKLAALSALCTLCHETLPEGDNLERFYRYIGDFFNLINEDNWLARYCYFEFYLLEYLGVGLDLTECSATGTTENLRYVSPKSGKAVCAEAGEPYKNRLFAYPNFIIHQNNNPTKAEITDLLRLTGFFLHKNFFQTHGLKFPENRANLLTNLGLTSF